MSQASTRKEAIRYKYDAWSARPAHIVGGKENTKFIHDGEDVLVDDNAGTLTKYLNGEGIDNQLRQTIGSTPGYFLADHLAASIQLIFFAYARKMISCLFIAFSTAISGYNLIAFLQSHCPHTLDH